MSMVESIDSKYRGLCAALGDLMLKKEAVDAEVAKIRFAIKKLVEDKQAHLEQLKKVEQAAVKEKVKEVQGPHGIETVKEAE